MEYHVGDIVIIRRDLAKIDTPISREVGINKDMLRYAGVSTIISRVNVMDRCLYSVKVDDGMWNWIPEFFEHLRLEL